MIGTQSSREIIAGRCWSTGSTTQQTSSFTLEMNLALQWEASSVELTREANPPEPRFESDVLSSCLSSA